MKNKTESIGFLKTKKSVCASHVTKYDQTKWVGSDIFTTKKI